MLNMHMPTVYTQPLLGFWGSRYAWLEREDSGSRIRWGICQYRGQPDSRVLCNVMGHPAWAKNTNYNTPGMHFWAIFTKKKSHNSVENCHIGNNLHLHWRLPIRSFSWNTMTMLHCVWPLRMYFWAIFTQKMAITMITEWKSTVLE